MIITSWNISGLNDPSKIREGRSLINDNKVNVCAIFEIRVKKQVERVKEKLSTKWN